jgi:hypothetical protein
MISRSHPVSPHERELRCLISCWLGDNAPGCENARPRGQLMAALRTAGREEHKPWLADLADRRMRDVAKGMLECERGAEPILSCLTGYYYGGKTGHYFADLVAYAHMLRAKGMYDRRKVEYARLALEEEHRRKQFKAVPFQRELVPVTAGGEVAR